MWIFTKYGYFSIVKDQRNSEHYQIRSRTLNDIKNVVKLLELTDKYIITTSNADYLYRIVIDKSDYKSFMDQITESVNYTNFKDMTHNTLDQIDKSELLLEIWCIMKEYQENNREENETL